MGNSATDVKKKTGIPILVEPNQSLFESRPRPTFSEVSVRTKIRMAAFTLIQMNRTNGAIARQSFFLTPLNAKIASGHRLLLFKIHYMLKKKKITLLLDWDKMCIIRKI